MAIPGSLGGSFEVMSGKGGWSSAMERVGFTGERGDWMDDVNSPHNYLVEENRLSLERRIANKEFKFVHVGLDCLTFSTASGGCYRSKVHLLGKPNLKPHLQRNVNDHNILATVKLFQLDLVPDHWQSTQRTCDKTTYPSRERQLGTRFQLYSDNTYKSDHVMHDIFSHPLQHASSQHVSLQNCL